MGMDRHAMELPHHGPSQSSCTQKPGAPRWMLDNDFCDINRLAAKHLEHQSTVRDEVGACGAGVEVKSDVPQKKLECRPVSW